MLRHTLIVAGIGLAPVAAAFGQVAEQITDQTSNLSDVSFNSKEFRAPEGFAGYPWNTSLGKVGRLEAEPVYVRVVHSNGTVVSFDSSCHRNLVDKDGNGLWDSDADNILAMRECRETEGDGYYALAEYYVDSQGFRVSDDSGKVVLFPITYQFCAQWKGFSNKFKGDPLETMRLCGVRLHFRSETAQQQAMTDQAHRTAFERTRNWLIEAYGPPEDFEREGEVLIPNWGGEQPRNVPAAIRHKNQYWCRPNGDALVPRCTASIVLSFDAETGRGQVIFLTPPVWVYAHARQFGGAEGDPLYRVLHGGMAQPKVEHQCMDTFLCKPPRPAAMPKEMLDRFRLANKNMDAK